MDMSEHEENEPMEKTGEEWESRNSADQAMRRLFHWKALIQSMGDSLLWNKDDEKAKDYINRRLTD